jgi:hypothetical protein
MFSGPGARTYDFSRVPTLAVAVCVFIVCFLGCVNTYYPHFLRVSQLPPDRNELTALKSISFSNNLNRFEINFTLSAIFTITRENFFKSLKVKHTQGAVSLFMARSEWLDYRSNGDFHKFSLLTPLYGAGHVSIQYLDTVIVERDVNIENIAHFFPKTTLVTHQANEFRFASVCVENTSLVTFFTGDGHFSPSGAFQLANGGLLQHNAQRGNVERFIGQKNGSCGAIIPDHSHLFIEPVSEARTPLSTIQGLLIPVSKYRREFADRRITVLLSQNISPFVWYLRMLNDIDFLQASDCRCFSHVNVRTESSDTVEDLRAFLPDAHQENVIGILIDHRGVAVSQAQDMVNILMPGARAVGIDMSASTSDVITSIRRTKGIVCQRMEYLGHMIALRSGSVVGLLNGQDEDWIFKLGRLCGVATKRFMRDADERTIAVDWQK